jgi:ribosomal 30S subunit maturation factor RimM
MKILRMLKTWVTAKGLEVLLLGKKVTLPDGASLGAVVSIKKELSQDKIWMVVNEQAQERVIPIEQIASVTNKVVLFVDLSTINLEGNGN